MAPDAVRQAETATALLLRARQTLQQDGYPEEATEALRAAVVHFCRAYLIDRGHECAEAVRESEDPCLKAFFAAAPAWLGAKVAVLLRKSNYLMHGVPYTPPVEDDESLEWDAVVLRDEITIAARESASLLAYLVEKGRVADFRGEERLSFVPGSWVQYSEFDWGTWRRHAAVVLEARWPSLLIRYEDRRLDELDITIAHIRPLDRPPVDLEEPLEARRTAFEHLLYFRELEPEAARPGQAVLGPARHLRTCPCCGYPTRRLRVPDYARLPQNSHPLAPSCILCGWNDSDPRTEAEPDRVPGGANRRYSLSSARSNFERTQSMFADDDAHDEALQHREPEVRRMKNNALGVLDSIPAAARGERDDLWRTAWSLLRRISGESARPGERAERDSRIDSVLRNAAAELPGPN